MSDFLDRWRLPALVFGIGFFILFLGVTIGLQNKRSKSRGVPFVGTLATATLSIICFAFSGYYIGLGHYKDASHLCPDKTYIIESVCQVIAVKEQAVLMAPDGDAIQYYLLDDFPNLDVGTYKCIKDEHGKITLVKESQQGQ